MKEFREATRNSEVRELREVTWNKGGESIVANHVLVLGVPNQEDFSLGVTLAKNNGKSTYKAEKE